jgi:hypothetical protein
MLRPDGDFAECPAPAVEDTLPLVSPSSSLKTAAERLR